MSNAEPSARRTTHLTRDAAWVLGWTLDDLISRTIAAIQSFEA